MAKVVCGPFLQNLFAFSNIRVYFHLALLWWLSRYADSDHHVPFRRRERSLGVLLSSRRYGIIRTKISGNLTGSVVL